MPVDQWEIRITAAREAQTRSRFAFLVATIISISVTVAIFNAQLSWLRNFAVPPSYVLNPLQEEMRRDTRKAWLESNRIRIPLLGVDIAASDASILGSISLYIITVWFFYCMRRENHLIGSLLIDARKNNDDEISIAVYHGVASYTVFTAIGGDQPISDFDQPHRYPVAKIRPVYVALLFLPPLTILFMIATDIWSLFRPAIMRDPSRILYEILSGREVLEVAAIAWIAGAILVAVAHQCFSILKCEQATEKMLRDFHGFLFPVPPDPTNVRHSRRRRRG